PIDFIIFKAGAMTSLPKTIMGTVEMPINATSWVAMDPKELPSKYCTQCHRLENRETLTSPGIIMDHAAHTDLYITCTACHNRVGHNELINDWQPIWPAYPPELHDSQFHDCFMLMTACYRCHRFEEDDGQRVTTPYPIGEFPGATGECYICHTDNFELVPDNHNVPRFVEDIHGPWYIDIVESIDNFIAGPLDTYNDMTGRTDPYSMALDQVPSVRAVNYCYTCHTTRFCDDCHGGLPMPHPDGYLLQPHIDDATNYPDSCEICHTVSPVNNTPAAAGDLAGTSAGDTCSACHHREEYITGWEFDPRVNWEWIQHADAAREVGGDSCTRCHADIQWCETCHVNFDRDELARWQARGNPSD
ncbi:MAG: hypothetical protein FWD93_06550, partial [Coriobacteriia bacterium]|nr:hypothetical protein [Coriobacteriia bacterium]